MKTKTLTPHELEVAMSTNIDQLIVERKHAESLGMAQNEKDSLFLLSLLLEDVKRNPIRYV